MNEWIRFGLMVFGIMAIGWVGAAIYTNWGTHRSSKWFGVLTRVFKNK